MERAVVGLVGLGFSVAVVGRGASESTVDVNTGTRRTMDFWMLCVLSQSRDSTRPIRSIRNLKAASTVEERYQ